MKPNLHHLLLKLVGYAQFFCTFLLSSHFVWNECIKSNSIREFHHYHHHRHLWSQKPLSNEYESSNLTQPKTNQQIVMTELWTCLALHVFPLSNAMHTITYFQVKLMTITTTNEPNFITCLTYYFFSSFFFYSLGF